MPDLASASLTAACAGSAAASNAATMTQVCKRLDLCGGVRMRFMAKPPNTLRLQVNPMQLKRVSGCGEPGNDRSGLFTPARGPAGSVKKPSNGLGLLHF